MNTENNKSETNRLIAEFMNFKKLSNHIYNSQDILFSIEQDTNWFLEDLKFHTDWNWLMEVVEKIESLHESNNILIGTNITYVQIHNKVSNEQETFKGVSHIKIEAVYNACVTFIKWL